MKKIKFLLLLLTATTVLFYSCSDSNPVENEAVASKSITLRATLNEIKKANPAGKTALATQDQASCFNFVYPITLSYNNGTQITVVNFAGLLEIVANENTALYIDGIVFPFEVQQEGAVTTINNEAEFYALIQDCGNIPTVNNFVFDFTCYSILYPISIINANNETVTINNQTELMQLISTPTGNSTYQLNIVFPVTVVQQNQSIVINSLYEFFELNNDCNESSSCFCPAVYQPVCVQTATGIVEYSNACFAECDGFTQNDFVNCDGSGQCTCPGNVDPVCVQTTTGVVQFNNACLAECAGYTSADFITCGTNPNPTFGQLLGTCFNITYPVEVNASATSIVLVNNNGELLQYWNPAQSSMPSMVYPITVTFGNETYTFGSQSGFQEQINTHCN